MFKRVTFKFKIIGIILIVLILVCITGLYAYKQFSAIVSSISENARPDLRLVTSKALMNDISDAENSVKSFSLTKDTIYLDQFYIAAEKTSEKLNKLHDISQSDEIKNSQLYALDTLINKKFKILNELLIVRDQFRVQEALDKVVIKLDKAFNDIDIKQPNDTNQASLNSSEHSVKKGILDWLFKRNKKTISDSSRSNQTTTVITNIRNSSDEKISFSEANKEVQKIKEEEETIETRLKTRELYLIMVDKKITKEIKTILDNIEASELLAISKQVEHAKIAMKNTNRQVALFCIATVILLLLMAFIIFDYIRNNNRYRRALKKAKEEAEDHATTKEKFLANMSHEIRTPMNVIAGFTEQIGKGPLTKEQNEQLAMVRKSIEHLLYLINDVLDITKLQAGKVNLETIGFKPIEVINDLITFIKPLADDKKLSLKCNITLNNSTILLGDPFRLRQILLNIISNAIKFTDEGSISIKVTTVMEQDKKTILRFEMADTGIGMEKKYLDKIFQEFEQANASTSRNYGGTGLGLSIVSKLVTLHNGNVEFSSTPKKGTNVILELPYLIGNENDLELLPERESIADLTLPINTKILIVDDVEFNRKLLISILKKYSIIYTEATNGKEAVSEIKRNNYDLILMDARMPELDGLEAAKKIRSLSDSTKSKTPIIVVTAAVTEYDKKRYRLAGMNGFIAKPYKEHELLTEINHVLFSNSGGEIIAQNKSPQLLKNNTSCEINFTELKTISNGDQVFYVDMLNTFLEVTEKGLNDIENSKNNKNWKMVAEFAHKISSPCNHLSAKILYNHLKEIEHRCRHNDDIDTIDKIILLAKEEFKLVTIEVKGELKKQTKC